MKKLMLVASFLFSQYALAEGIAKIEYQPGFEADPKKYDLILDESGSADVSVLSFRGNQAPLSFNVAKLSPEVMAKLSKIVSGADLTKPLIDLQAGEPECTDTPTVTVYALVKGVETAVYRTAGCHEFRIEENYELYGLTQALDGLLSLAQLTIR